MPKEHEIQGPGARVVTTRQSVRFHLDGDANSDHWITARIENGQLRLVAYNALTILPHAANVASVENRKDDR